MKKILLLTILIILFSCSKEDAEKYPLLNTTWESVVSDPNFEGDYITTLHFRTAKSGNMRISLSEYYYYVDYEFNYELSGNNNIYIEPQSNEMPSYLGTYNEKTMTLKVGDETYIFNKILNIYTD